MKTNLDIKVDVNAVDILKIYWPVMTLPLVILMVIGAGGYFLSSKLSNEIHSVIVLYVYLIAGLLLYGGSITLFLNDVKKTINNPDLSKNQ